VQGLILTAHGPDPSLDPTSATKWWHKPPYPSYVPSRTFVAAITDLARDAETRFSEVDEEEAEAARARMKKAEAGLERTLASIPNARLSEALLGSFARRRPTARVSSERLSDGSTTRWNASQGGTSVASIGSSS
jgi:hypothetical protein